MVVEFLSELASVPLIKAFNFKPERRNSTRATEKKWGPLARFRKLLVFEQNQFRAPCSSMENLHKHGKSCQKVLSFEKLEAFGSVQMSQVCLKTSNNKSYGLIKIVKNGGHLLGPNRLS
jgi:hypothetical protein